jgi:chemotaxis protein MotB
MFKKTAITALLGAGFLLSGCVSLGKFHDLEKERNDLKARLEQTGAKAEGLEHVKAQLEQTNESLAKDKDTLSQEKDTLSQEKAALASQKEQLAQEKDQLAKQNAELMKAQEQAKSQFDNVVKQLQGEVKEGQLKVTQYKNMMSVDVAEKIFFNSGSANLKKEGRDVLAKVGGVLNQYPDKYIKVVGHTDTVPTGKGSAFASNWELSTARATGVVRFLQEVAGVGPARLVATGRAEYEPVADNATPEGRQKNRRIEIVLMDKALFESTQPSAQKSQVGGTESKVTKTAK